MSKNVGVWIDLKKASVILFNEVAKVIEVESNITTGAVKGGYGSSIPYASQNSVSESKILEKTKQQKHKYFEEISQHLSDIDYLILFGPAETKIEFHKYLNSKSGFDNTVIKEETADSMSENQKIAYARDFFQSID